MDNQERELVKVKCPIVEGNDSGYYVTYKDQMSETDELYEPEAEKDRVEPETKPPVKPGK